MRSVTVLSAFALILGHAGQVVAQTDDIRITPNKPKLVTLQCTVNYILNFSGKPDQIGLFVDPGKGTVNGHPAIVSPNQIAWSEESSSGFALTVVNRRTGAIKMTLKGTRFMEGICREVSGLGV